MLIILHHYKLDILSKNDLFATGIPSGAMGVSLFIILSGLSLTISSGKGDKLNIKEFYIRRFIAIYPLFWICYIFAFTVYSFMNGQFPINTSAPLATYFLSLIAFDGFLLYKIPNNYLIGEWFLGFIIIIYILYPLLRYFSQKSIWLTIIGCLFIHYFLFYHRDFTLGMGMMRFPLSRLVEFCIGIMFAIYFNNKRFRYFLFISFIFLFFHQFFVDGRTPFMLKLMILPPLFFSSMIAISYFIRVKYIKNIFTFLGKYAYGAFLLHHVIINVFFKYANTTIFSPFIGFLFILLLSFVSGFLLSQVSAYLVRKVKKFNLFSIKSIKNKILLLPSQ